MDKLHALLAFFQSVLLYKIAGVVPAWFPTFLCALAIASQAVKAAKWTTAERLIELICRGVLKIPVVGVWITAIPLLGDLLRYLANDTANLPPTALMRVKSFRAKQKAKSESKPPAEPPVTPPAAAPPGAAGTLPTVLILVLALSVAACAGAKAWSACTLGQLPQIAQTAIPTVVQVLQIDDQAQAVAQLENLGLGLLPGQISCIVQAIVADELARASLVKGMRSRASVAVVKNGQAFLAKHPATCCAAKPDGGT